MMRMSPPPTKTGVTLVVAASNSKHTERADYVCDGTSDETEINAAISALPSGGGCVKLLDGTFTLGGAIVLDNNIALIGNGAGTVITIPNTFNTSINFLDATSKTRVLIANLMVDGNRANQGAGTMYVTNFNGCSYFKIIDCWFENIRSSGLYFRGGGGHSTIIGNHIMNSGLTAISLSTPDYMMVVGNYVEGTVEEQIVCQGMTNSTIANNVVYNGTRDGITIGGSSNYNTVTGNTIHDNGRHGIFIDSSDSNTVTGNNIYSNAPSGNYDGICIDNNSDYNVIVGNRCRDHARDEIRIDDSTCTYNLVGNNTCEGTHTAAIVDSGTNSQVFNNIES